MANQDHCISWCILKSACGYENEGGWTGLKIV